MSDYIVVVEQPQTKIIVQDNTTDHRALDHRTAADAHPTSAITGLDTALGTKVDKVEGKGLSTEDYASAEKSKLAGVADNANNYTHPTNHSADIIIDGTTNKAYTATEQSKLAGIAAGATANVGTVTSVTGTAPIASSGGVTPAISISAATTSAAGSMSSADKTKIDGIAVNANNYTHPNHSGDVTSTGDGATVIAAKAVTLAKMADMATASLLGRNTAAAGVPEALSVATAKTMLAINNVDNTSDANKPVSTAQAEAIAAKVAQTITNGVTTSAPSQDAVFDALALKASANGFNPPQQQVEYPILNGPAWGPYIDCKWDASTTDRFLKMGFRYTTGEKNLLLSINNAHLEIPRIEGQFGVGCDPYLTRIHTRQSLESPYSLKMTGRNASQTFAIAVDVLLIDDRKLGIFNVDYGTRSVVIDQFDNVGIGTDNPSAKLSINGGCHVGGDSDPGDNNLLVDGNVSVGSQTFRSPNGVGPAISLVTCSGDGGGNTARTYFSIAFGASNAGGCLGAYKSDGSHAGPDDAIVLSNYWTIYGVIKS